MRPKNSPWRCSTCDRGIGTLQGFRVDTMQPGTEHPTRAFCSKKCLGRWTMGTRLQIGMRDAEVFLDIADRFEETGQLYGPMTKELISFTRKWLTRMKKASRLNRGGQS